MTRSIEEFHPSENSKERSSLAMLASFSETPIAGHNRLMDNAARLFSILHHCERHRRSVPLSFLHQELLNEIRLFQKRSERDYKESAAMLEFIPIAVYWISMTLDHVISAQPWVGVSQWRPFELSSSVISEPILPEHFSVILERLINEQDVYIDALECIYVCLNLGFSSAHFVRNAYFTREQIPFLLDILQQKITSVRRRPKVKHSEEDTSFCTVETFPASSLRRKKIIAASIFFLLFIGQIAYFQMKQDPFLPRVQLALLEPELLTNDQISVSMQV